MTSSGFIFTKIDNLWDKEISGLKVLIIGKDAVKPQFRKEGSILNEFVKKGGRVILMEQGLIETLDWLPFKIDIDKSSAQSAGTTIRTDLPILEDITERGLSSTMAFRMIPDHPILENIEENDLKYWRGTHQVSNNNFYRPKFWNFTTVAYVGGGNGIEHTPLITLPYGSGLFIFSQFVISDEMSKESAAYILFNNILKYSLNYTASFYRAGIWASKGSFLYKTLTNFGADIEYIDDFPPSDLSVYKILFIDSDINLEKYKVTLERFLVGGGKIVLRELTPEKFENVKYILPLDISLKPISELEPMERAMLARKCPIRAYKTGYDPLLAGITNFDLYWRTPSGYNQMFGDEIAPIASYVLTGGKINALTKPAIIAKIPSGNGEIIIDQIDWETGLKKVTDNTCRIISNMLNNLRIKMKPNISFNEE